MALRFFLWEVFVNLITCISYSFLLFRRLGISGISGKGKLAFFIGTVLVWVVITGINYIDINLSLAIVPGINVYLTRFITMALMMAFAILAFKGELSKRILWGLVPPLITAIADYTASLIGIGILGATYEDSFTLGNTRVLLTICFALIVIGACLLLAFAGKKKPKSDLHIPVSARILLIAMLIVGTIAVDILIDRAFVAAEAGMVVVSVFPFVVGSIFLLLILMAFALVVQIGFLSRKNMDYALEIRQKKLEQAYYHNLEIIIDGIQKFKHDMQSHTQTIRGLLQQKAYGELEEYFRTVDEKFRQMPHMHLTGNNTINALLTGKAVIAETEAIPFHYRSNDSLENISFVSLQYYDLCSVLGNLLDNAIEACRKLDAPQRYINLAIEKRAAMLIIRVENSYNGKYQKVNNSYLSDKAGVGHGMGLNNVRDIVAKCGGNLRIGPTKDAFITSVFIPLNTQES